MTVREAADFLGMWVSSVRNLIHADPPRFRAQKGADGRWLLNPDDVRNYKITVGGQESPGLSGEAVPDGADLEGDYTHREDIRELLAARGMSIQSFAKAMGVDVSLFYRIENRERSATPKYRYKASRLLKFEHDRLFVRY